MHARLQPSAFRKRLQHLCKRLSVSSCAFPASVCNADGPVQLLDYDVWSTISRERVRSARTPRTHARARQRRTHAPGNGAAAPLDDAGATSRLVRGVSVDVLPRRSPTRCRTHGVLSSATPTAPLPVGCPVCEIVPRAVAMPGRSREAVSYASMTHHVYVCEYSCMTHDHENSVSNSVLALKGRRKTHSGPSRTSALPRSEVLACQRS